MKNKIEDLLRDYYKKQWKLNHITLQIKRLNTNIIEIQRRIEEGINIISLPGVARGVSPQKANAYSEGLERAMIELEESLARLKAELGEKTRKRNSLEMKKRALEEDLASTGIEFCFQLMTENEKSVLEQRFLYRRDFSGAGRALHMSRDTARYWHDKAMKRISEDLNIA